MLAATYNRKRIARKPFWKWAVRAVIVILVLCCFRFVFKRPPFDADKVAQAETRMWQAYYSGERIQLGAQVIALLRNQYGLPLFEAKGIGETLAHAAMKFQAASRDYDRIVLPDLLQAYTLIKRATRASFDSEKAARAELAWWVARRTTGQNSPEQVGAKIAELYAVVYGQACPAFTNAGVLRAWAGALRDSGKQAADWKQVEELLKRSYHELQAGM